MSYIEIKDVDFNLKTILGGKESYPFDLVNFKSEKKMGDTTQYSPKESFNMTQLKLLNFRQPET